MHVMKWRLRQRRGEQFEYCGDNKTCFLSTWGEKNHSAAIDGRCAELLFAWIQS